MFTYQRNLTGDELERQVTIPDVVWELGLSPSEFVVLAYILRHKRRDNTLESNTKIISKKCDLPMRSINRIIYTLHGLNIIEIVNRLSCGLPDLFFIKNPTEWCPHNEGTTV